jgi:hypothetical protein
MFDVGIVIAGSHVGDHVPDVAVVGPVDHRHNLERATGINNAGLIVPGVYIGIVEPWEDGILVNVGIDGVSV